MYLVFLLILCTSKTFRLLFTILLSLHGLNSFAMGVTFCVYTLNKYLVYHFLIILLIRFQLRFLVSFLAIKMHLAFEFFQLNVWVLSVFQWDNKDFSWKIIILLLNVVFFKIIQIVILLYLKKFLKLESHEYVILFSLTPSVLSFVWNILLHQLTATLL